MSVDTKVRRAVQRAIHVVGTAAILRRHTIGTYSPSIAQATGTTTDVDVVGRIDDYMDREFSDTIQAGDRKFTIAALDLDFVPLIHDAIILDDEDVFDVIRVTTERVKDEPALYVLQLRA